MLPSGFGPHIHLAFFDAGWFKSRQSVCISGLTVVQEDWRSRTSGSVIWQIKAQHGCTTTAAIDVGRVPNGFKTIVNHLPLKPGNLYEAWADAEPFGGTSYPWFTCRGSPEILDWPGVHDPGAPSKSCK